MGLLFLLSRAKLLYTRPEPESRPILRARVPLAAHRRSAFCKSDCSLRCATRVRTELSTLLARLIESSRSTCVQTLEHLEANEYDRIRHDPLSNMPTTSTPTTVAQAAGATATKDMDRAIRGSMTRLTFMRRLWLS